MAKSSGPWKGIAILGAVVVIFSVLAYYISASLGAWWQLTIDGWLGTETGYMDGFGMYHYADEDPEMVLGYLGVVAGVLLIIGPILVIVGGLQENKAVAVVGSLLVIGGLALFIYGLYNIDSDGYLAQFLQALDESEDYYIHFGSFEFFGIEWSWRIGTGFIIAIVGAVITVIGSIKMDV